MQIYGFLQGYLHRRYTTSFLQVYHGIKYLDLVFIYPLVVSDTYQYADARLSQRPW